MLFDRAEKPNTTIEEWGVITRTGLFAHGTDPNPLVGPSSYICHSGTGTAAGLEVIRKNCFDWTKTYEKQQAASLRPTKWSVKRLIERLNDTRFTASDVQQSAPHPTAINVVRSFNATSTEHELYEIAFSGTGVQRDRPQSKALATPEKVFARPDLSPRKPEGSGLVSVQTLPQHQVSPQAPPRYEAGGLHLETQPRVKELNASERLKNGTDAIANELSRGVLPEVKYTDSVVMVEPPMTLNVAKTDKNFESVQAELNALENELNEMLRKFELQNMIKSRIEQTQSAKLKEAVEKAREAAERFDYAVHGGVQTVEIIQQEISPFSQQGQSGPIKCAVPLEKSIPLSSFESDKVVAERRLAGRTRARSTKKPASAEKLLLRDIERLTRKLELYRPYNDEEDGFADDEEEEKGDDAYTHRSSRAAEDTQKSGVNPVYNAVHELISEVAL